jgi:photosystem II stability/assembly factor-like uncharacterized protein
VVDEQTVVEVELDGSKVYTSDDAGENWSLVSPKGLPTGVVDIDFTSADAGWALVQTNECLTLKDNCIQAQDVHATKDGGQTWAPLALP